MQLLIQKRFEINLVKLLLNISIKFNKESFAAGLLCAIRIVVVPFPYQ